MPGIVRTILDVHTGHAARPGPYHKTYYAEGSPDVYANNEHVVRKSDPLTCGDKALAHSPNVFANNIPVHRKDDATTGHGTWPSVKAETGSGDVIVNG